MVLTVAQPDLTMMTLLRDGRCCSVKLTRMSRFHVNKYARVNTKLNEFITILSLKEISFNRLIT